MNKFRSFLCLSRDLSQIRSFQSVFRRFSSLVPDHNLTSKSSSIVVLNDGEVNLGVGEVKSGDLDVKSDIGDVFDVPQSDLSDYGPFARPTFNLAALVNKSECLQQLVKLGVDLYKIERRKDAPELIMKQSFEKVKEYIVLLNDLGVEDLGRFFTINPFIFRHSIEDLRIRVNYLEFKSFDKEAICRIVNKNPYWLTFSTKRIDRRLGHFQKTFELSGEETRLLASREPRLITYNMNHVNLNTFSIKEEMGFDKGQIKTLLLNAPKLWMMGQDSIIRRFDYIHNTMKISHEQILLFPNILKCRKSRLKQRHQFLTTLNRAQYDPKIENYVSLNDLITGTDAEFCKNVAKSSVDTYNTFLKSL